MESLPVEPHQEQAKISLKIDDDIIVFKNTADLFAQETKVNVEQLNQQHLHFINQYRITKSSKACETEENELNQCLLSKKISSQSSFSICQDSIAKLMKCEQSFLAATLNQKS
ncbi:hypothetical protein CYY_008622 [Polysphondylium violaceum]|uniref:Uncharacterized protein n=1 Tax=Polysphondylium violaceum TaxID=133409 RepID=A0A8J4PMR8_9MYCE|nr:hypothetical protein CYY_008622 [Polysphondylium violaceum]